MLTDPLLINFRIQRFVRLGDYFHYYIGDGPLLLAPCALPAVDGLIRAV